MSCVALTLLTALGAEPEVEKDPDKMVWSGVVLPLFGANSQDGPGFGLGGEVFGRPRSMEQGFKIKFSGLIWVTTNFGYTSDYVQLDYRGETHVVGQVGFRAWRNHAYAGSGGADVLLLRGDDEIGNRVFGPYAFLGAARPIGGDWSLFAQAYYKGYRVTPGETSILGSEQPYGSNGAQYVDLTLGVEHDSTDRWPMPHRGIRAEWSARVGATFPSRDDVGFLVGSYAEAIGWTSFGRHLTVAGRLVGDQTAGRRPFFDQDIAGGRWRDEIGSEQSFSGYGRTRTRGDGFLAALVEVRPYFFETRGKVLDLEFHASGYAEIGLLTGRGVVGPVMPTIGFGPQVLFQGAIQCRPFVAWGWRAESPDDPRRPVAQYGISFMDPL